METVLSLYRGCAVRALLSWARESGCDPAPEEARDQIEEFCLPFRELAGDYLRDELWEAFIDEVVLPHAESVLDY